MFIEIRNQQVQVFPNRILKTMRFNCNMYSLKHICQIPGPRGKSGPPDLVLWPLLHSPLSANRVTHRLPMPFGNLGKQFVHLTMAMHHPQQTLNVCHILVLAANQGLIWAVHGCTAPQLVSYESWMPCISVRLCTANSKSFLAAIPWQGAFAPPAMHPSRVECLFWVAFGYLWTIFLIYSNTDSAYLEPEMLAPNLEG